MLLSPIRTHRIAASVIGCHARPASRSVTSHAFVSVLRSGPLHRCTTPARSPMGDAVKHALSSRACRPKQCKALWFDRQCSSSARGGAQGQSGRAQGAGRQQGPVPPPPSPPPPKPTGIFIETACGILGAACFASILIPQALLNYQRGSTEGLSLGLITLWHVAALIYTSALVASGASVWILASMASFITMSAVVEAQVAVYMYEVPTPFALLAAGLTVVSGVGGGLLARMISAMPASGAALFGHALPSVFFSLGFIPQFRIFVETWSIEGYSLSVSALDVIGSAANMVLLARAGTLWPDSLPLVTIIVLHFALVALAGWIVVTPKAVEGPSGPSRKSQSALSSADE